MVVVIYHREAHHLAAQVRAAHPDLEILACVTAPEAAARLGEAEVLLAAGGLQLPEGSPPHLRWVQTLAAGVDRLVDTLPPGVVLTRGHSLHNAAMAEHCLGRILAHTLNLRQALANQAGRRWQHYPVERLAGKTLGIAGMGVIGGAIARRARAFELRVLGWRRSGRRARYVEQVFGPEGLYDFLVACDFVVILLPLTPETRGRFGTREFEAMKPGAVLMNLGRGPVVREDELVAGLRSGRPAHALLDVFEEEPLPLSSPLWELPNVTITPHCAGGTTTAAALELFLANLDRFRAGRPLVGRVDRTRGY